MQSFLRWDLGFEVQMGLNWQMQIAANLVLPEPVWMSEACIGIKHMCETLENYRPCNFVDWLCMAGNADQGTEPLQMQANCKCDNR